VIDAASIAVGRCYRLDAGSDAAPAITQAVLRSCFGFSSLRFGVNLMLQSSRNPHSIRSSGGLFSDRQAGDVDRLARA
jgi:hypothetical protein